MPSRVLCAVLLFALPISAFRAISTRGSGGGGASEAMDGSIQVIYEECYRIEALTEEEGGTYYRMSSEIRAARQACKTQCRKRNKDQGKGKHFGCHGCWEKSCQLVWNCQDHANRGDCPSGVFGAR